MSFFQHIKDIFQNPKKRRVLMTVLLICLIIVILLLISRCTRVGNFNIGGGNVTDNYIWEITDPPSSGGGTTENPPDDTTDEPKDTTEPPETTEKPEDTTTKPSGGGSTEPIPQKDITLRAFFPDNKDSFFEDYILPGSSETGLYRITSKYNRTRDLYMTLNVTKDITASGAKVADVMNITVECGDFKNTATFTELNGTKIKIGSIAANSTVECKVTVFMSTSADNRYLNATCGATFVWSAE